MPRLTLVFLVSLLLLAGEVGAQCQTSSLLPSDGAASDTFGNSVSLWGGRAIVTSIFDNGISFDSGSAYVYERQGGVWVEVAKLIASDTAEEDRFGHSSGIYGDQAIVGARYNQDAGYGTGSAYVFERGGGVWTETAYLVAPVMQSNGFFGQSVDIENDVAVVGASLEDGPAGVNQGVAHVYEKQLGAWGWTQSLTASDASVNDRFGEALAMDGTVLVVGARGESTAGAQAGAAYVYESVGGVWTETKKLIAGDPEDAAIFGVHVAVSGDVIAVSALLEDSVGPDTGAVYVFERNGSDWVQTGKLLPDAGSATMFGSVGVGDSGIVVGAWSDSSVAAGAGAAYRFQKVGGLWRKQGKFTSTMPTDSDAFGTAVAQWEDEVMVTARGAQDPMGIRTGEAYLFDRINNVAPYGVGTAGTGGLTPMLTICGCAGPGDSLSVDVSDGLPGSTAVMLFGATQAAVPLLGCTLLMYPLFPLMFNLPLDGTGSVAFSGFIPASLTGTIVIKTQAFIIDAGGSQGFSCTAGVSLTIEG